MENEQLIIDIAKTDFNFGYPIEDYREFSKICRDEGIKPTEALWNLYQDNYGPLEDEYDEEEDW